MKLDLDTRPDLAHAVVREPGQRLLVVQDNGTLAALGSPAKIIF